MGWQDAPEVNQASPAWMSAPEENAAGKSSFYEMSGDKRKKLATAGASPSMPENPLANVIGDPLANYNANLDNGAQFGIRAGASIKMTPEGKVNYLKAKLGPENVAVRRDGEVFYRNPGDLKWAKFDERGASIADVADLTGGTIEAAPSIAAGFFTRNPYYAGAAAAAGNVIRQGISAALPGSDEMTVAGRVARPVISGVLAGAAQKGANILADRINDAKPSNIIASKVTQAIDTPEAKRAAQLTEKTGIRFTPGQETGSRTLLGLEGLARRSPLSADKVASDVDRPQIQQAMKYLNGVLDNVDKRGLGSIQVGQQVENAYNGTVNRLVNARRAQAASDFGAVSKLAGNRPVFALNNVVKEIDDLTASMHTPVGSDTANKTLESLMRLREKLVGTPAGSAQVERGIAAYGQATGNPPLSLTPEQFQRTLQIWGSAAKGTGNIVEDLGDKATNRMINSRLFGALVRDMDEAADSPGVSGQAAAALKLARDNYKSASSKIDDVTGSVLGRIFNGKFDPAPESIANRFMTMQPSEIKSAMGIIAQHDPDAAQAVKRNMIEQALEAGRPSGGQAQINVTPILGGKGTRIAGNELSPAKFNSFLAKNAEKYRAALSPKEVAEMKWAYESLGRLADRGGTEGSPTTPLAHLADLAKAAYGMQPKLIASATGQGYAVRKIASIMATDEGRKALVTISRASPNTKAFEGAAATLSGFLYRDDAEFASSAPQLSQRNPQSAQDQSQQ